jgi:hypothetical protein
MMNIQSARNVQIGERTIIDSPDPVDEFWLDIQRKCPENKSKI